MTTTLIAWRSAVSRAVARKRLVRAIYDHHSAARDLELAEAHLRWLKSAEGQASDRKAKAHQEAP